MTAHEAMLNTKTRRRPTVDEAGPRAAGTPIERAVTGLSPGLLCTLLFSRLPGRGCRYGCSVVALSPFASIENNRPNVFFYTCMGCILCICSHPSRTAYDSRPCQCGVNKTIIKRHKRVPVNGPVGRLSNQAATDSETLLSQPTRGHRRRGGG
ncbi:hypothetical protein EDB85DRAFT_764809 [Lactarius pseudohatsudake]|nr:hypothetical protein EDB85DRAFT_764809 [Lactarius pseudohatsudake]